MGPLEDPSSFYFGGETQQTVVGLIGSAVHMIGAESSRSADRPVSALRHHPRRHLPDYALPDHTGIVRTLSELQGRDPLILTLARGHYCPKEHQQHLGLAAFQSKIAVAYTQIVTISTDEHHTLQEFRASVGAQWTFLSDPGGRSGRTSTSRSTPTPTTTR